MMRTVFVMLLALASFSCAAQVKVLTVWHSAAKAWAESHTQPAGCVPQSIEEITQRAIDQTNSAFAKSDMFVRVVNVGVFVSNSAKLNTSDYYGMRGLLMGNKAVVRERDAREASVIMLITMADTRNDTNPDGSPKRLLGLAGWNSWEAPSGLNAVAVVGVKSVVGVPEPFPADKSFVYTHELGHVLGGEHSASYHIGIHQGVPIGARDCFRTVMSPEPNPLHDAQCVSAGRGAEFDGVGGQMLRLMFSSSKTIYDPVLRSIGDEQHDNAANIEYGASKVAWFGKTPLLPRIFPPN